MSDFELFEFVILRNDTPVLGEVSPAVRKYLGQELQILTTPIKSPVFTGGIGYKVRHIDGFEFLAAAMSLQKRPPADTLTTWEEMKQKTGWVPA